MKLYFTLLLVISAIFMSAEMRVLERSSERMIVQIELKDYNFFETGDFTYIELNDWSRNLDRGAPDLPLKEMRFAVPPDGRANIMVISQNVVTKHLDKPVSPVANIVKGGKTNDYIYQIDPAKYASYTTEFLQLDEVNNWRRFQTQKVQFNPFLFDPVSQELRICESITFEVRMEGNTNFRKVINDNCEDIYSEYFVNYQEAKFWRTVPKITPQKMPFEVSDFWYKFSTEDNGIYELDFAQLSQLPSFCDPNSIRLLTMYRQANSESNSDYEFRLIEIPLLVEDDNSILDENDKIYFEKTELETGNFKSYGSKKTYWLTFGADLAEEPQRLANLTGTQTAFPVQDFARKIIETSYSRDTVEGILIYPEAGIFDTQSDELIALHPELSLIKKSQAEIFAEYSSGDPDPVAIRSCLQDSLIAHPELLYCVLMGSGTSDWNNSSEKNKIITFGYCDDNFCIPYMQTIPQLAMGRIPAQNNSDMNFLLDRIQTYIESPTPGFWRDKILIIPDDENKGDHYEGLWANSVSGLNHSQIAQITGELLNPEIYVDKVMAIEYGFDEFQNKPEARLAMLRSVNEGRLIWYYIGHGNEDVLGDEDYFRGSLHMNLLDNFEHLPLFIAASCNVGHFDEVAYDCLAEKLLFYDNGGSIISIAATRDSDGNANTTLMKKYLTNSLNLMPRKTVGWSLFNAKLTSGANIGNSKLYHILGDPLMYVNPPDIVGSVTGVPDSVRSRQLVQLAGDFGSENLFNSQGELRVFEPEHNFIYINNNYVLPPDDTLMYIVNYTKEGNKLFFGGNEINSGEYSAEFIVPDDMQTGDNGQIINYYFDPTSNQDFISAFDPMKCSSIPLDVSSTSPPQVALFVDSKNFVSGDYVSTNPVVIAEIQDENGINITGSAGHKLLILLDEGTELIDVTEGFVYDLGSATAGELSWQLNDLEEGKHNLTLIVFDNFNTPTVTETEFIAKKSGKVSIEQMLPYPNPIEKDGHFTFVITEDADITITIYTITGRKIKTIKKPACGAGYNQIYWNGKDGDGDEIANNTYFYKIKAKQLSNHKISEKIGKVIVLR
ncbi:MAG: C25 family cysteine peptidase [Candidatus Cloacimonadales bacterium]|nr:C25 family cysteine peptidase [Candidatus Cloacimonadales bacterium]